MDTNSTNEGITTMTTTTTHPRIKGDKPAKTVVATCRRCGGAGGWVGWPGFTCYRCFGIGMDPTDRDWGFPTDWTDQEIAQWTEAREARLQVARDKAQAKRDAKAESIWQGNLATFPILGVARTMQAEGEMDSDFVADILGKAHRFIITEKQAEAIVAAVARDAERAAQVAEREALEAMIVKANVPVGNGLTITGEVLTVKGQDTQWGYTEKMLVRCETVDGEFKVWGTVPASLEVERGESVTFVANVTASDDDPAFGFFSRPRKASVIAQ